MTQKQENGWKAGIALVSVLIAIVSGAIVIGGQNQKLEQTCQEQKEIKEKADVLAGKVAKHDTDIVKIQTDLQYIRSGVDEIKSEIKKGNGN